MFYQKPFVPPWRIQWSCCLQPCREMRWLWPTLYGRGLRHVLPLSNTLSKKRAHTSLQVARDDSLGSSHKRSRNMAKEARTAQVVVASPSHSKGDGAADVVSLLDPSDSFSGPEQPVATPSTLDRGLADFKETKRPPLSEAMALPCCL